MPQHLHGARMRSHEQLSNPASNDRRGIDWTSPPLPYPRPNLLTPPPPSPLPSHLNSIFHPLSLSVLVSVSVCLFLTLSLCLSVSPFPSLSPYRSPSVFHAYCHISKLSAKTYLFLYSFNYLLIC